MDTVDIAVSEMTNNTSHVTLSESHDHCRSHDLSESNEQLFMAFWEYTKRKPGEVSLRKGCMVDVLEKHLSGWWFVHVEERQEEGEERQEEGWAPGTYLLPLQQHPGSPSSVTRANSMNGLPWKCKATKDYSGRSGDDVSYTRGDSVEVLSANLDGWWQVRCNGKTGFTPGACLQRVTDSPRNPDEPLTVGSSDQRSIYLTGSPPSRQSPEQKLSHFPSKDSHAEITRSHDSVRSHDNGVERSCDTERNKEERKQHKVNYTQVYFDDSNTKSRDDVVVHRLDSGVKYTQVMICPQPACRTHVNVKLEDENKDNNQIEEKEGIVANDRRGSMTQSVTSDPSSLPRDMESRNGAQRVRAICDYRSHRKTVLSFNRDDEATLISKSPTGWWCVRLRDSCGWVPGNYWRVIQTKPSVPTRSSSKSAVVKDRNKCPTLIPTSLLLPTYESEPWFVGKMSRSESEALLETGSDLNFIVRESTNRIGDFTLSVLDEGHVRHFPIEVTSDHKYYVGRYHFGDLRKVVTYYSRQPLFYSRHKQSAVSLGQPRALCASSGRPS